jgi:hypothetical protein
MLNVERLINPSNVSKTIQFLLNLDLNAIDEKFLKIGLSNFVDLDKTKRLYFNLKFTDGETLSQKSENLVKQAINLTTLLNDEGKKSLVEFLAVQQNY